MPLVEPDNIPKRRSVRLVGATLTLVIIGAIGFHDLKTPSKNTETGVTSSADPTAPGSSAYGVLGIAGSTPGPTPAPSPTPPTKAGETPVLGGHGGTPTPSSKATACSTSLIPKSTGGYWQCAFDEEFSGSSLDASKWWAVTADNNGFGAGVDCFVDTPNNINVSGGVLSLTTRKEASAFTCTPKKHPAKTAQVTSATVSTAGKFSQQYGRFEIRARVPNITTKGLQESFWLWPDRPFDQDPGNLSWPATGEIDIAEIYHYYPDRAIPFIHYYPAAYDGNVTNNYCMIDISKFHNYLLTWTPDTIQVDIDGTTCLVDHPAPHSPQAAPQPFNKTFYINLTAGLGVTGNAYDENVTQLPATTQVDYVRVWK